MSTGVKKIIIIITIKPLLESMVSELPLGYLDDLTLGGEQSVVAKDVERVAEVGQLTECSAQQHIKFIKCCVSDRG